MLPSSPAASHIALSDCSMAFDPDIALIHHSDVCLNACRHNQGIWAGPRVPGSSNAQGCHQVCSTTFSTPSQHLQKVGYRITSQHCPIPNGCSLPQRYIANDCCTGSHKCSITNARQLSCHPLDRPMHVHCTAWNGLKCMSLLRVQALSPGMSDKIILLFRHTNCISKLACSTMQHSRDIPPKRR